MLSLTDLDISDQRLLIREDLNVPLDESGKISDDTRLQAALPTIRYALKQGAAVILLSHLGRPTEGKPDPNLSLAPVAEALSQLLEQPVRFEADWLSGINCQPGEVVLCENVRFCVGEKANDAGLAKQIACLGDIFVMDAFATAHRAQASTTGVAQFASQACAGPLLTAEINALSTALQDPKRPLIAIVGGAKVSSKLSVLTELTKKVDQLIVGGGIANTFLAAKGFPIGKSLHEPDLIATAKQLLDQVDMPLPTDVVVSETFSAQAVAQIKSVNDVGTDDLILDIGPETIKAYDKLLQSAGTILWNGPVGVFELTPFAAGTRAVAQAVADSPAFSIAGGGDTVAAIKQFQVSEQISYISTGGGAFLEFVEGKPLPALAALTK